jgi:hypothetical protein
MGTPRDAVFQSNQNKDFLRSAYDVEHIKAWFARVGRPLKYLGLPAWEMLDIIAWEAFLSKFTTIEREENQQHLMFLQANVQDVEHRLYSLYGEFDSILVSGRDAYGHGPDWPYDLINLDYFGGFLYSNLSRPKAIRKLISNQAAYSQGFLLIITQHLRDCDTIGAKATFLDDLRRSLKNVCADAKVHVSIDRVLDWYSDASTPDSFRQALYMNVFLRDVGELEHFDVKCRPAIVYAGTGNSSMIHFATEFSFRPGLGHKPASSQSLIDVVNFSLRELRNGAFAPPIQHPVIPIPS